MSPLTIFTLVYALLGWLVGIAINHTADILPTRKTLRRWVYCPACGARRSGWAWSGWLAILTRRAHCPTCGQQRPTLARAMIVELVTPAFFIFLAGHYGFGWHLMLVSIYTAILILITVTDLEYRLIFNLVILPSIVLALVAAFFTPGLYWPSALVGGGVAFALVYGAALLARGGLGEGDVTLSTFLGLIIGFPYILLTLAFAVFFGGFVALLLLLTRRVNMKSFIPYGPFLTIAGWIMLVWGPEIWAYYYG